MSEHNGHAYEEKQEGEASVNWVTDRALAHGKVAYRYELQGAHEGPPIEIWMMGAGLEYDEDGAVPSWDSLVWADDETPFDDDYLLDSYTDALRDDLREMLRQTGY